MKRAKRIFSWLLIAAMLATTCGIAEEFPEEAGVIEATPEPTAEPTPEPVPEPTVEPTAEPTPEPTAEPTSEPEQQTAAPEELPPAESEGGEADAPEGATPEPQLPDAPMVRVAPGWRFNAEERTLEIPCAAGDEAVRVEWTFDGAASCYAVQTAPLPAEGEPERRAELGFTAEKYIKLPVAQYLDGWYTLYIAAVMEDGAQVCGAQVFRLDAAVTDGATAEPTAEPTPEPTEVPIIDENPEPTAQATREPAPGISVRVERSAGADFQIVLRAVVETELAGDVAYRWQALDSAAYQEALLAGELPDVETLWTDIPGANGEILDPRAYFGEAFPNYCYRAIATVGEQEAASELFKYDPGETFIENADDAGEESIPKTPEELAEYLDVTLEELAEMLGLTMDELMALTEEEIEENYWIMTQPAPIANSTTERYTSGLYAPLYGLTKSSGKSGFIPNRNISESENKAAHLAQDYVTSTGNWEVRPIYDGRVKTVHKYADNGAGRYVILEHSLGGITVYSIYQHLTSTIYVKEGQSVQGGVTPIAIAGTSGVGDGAYDHHLHLGIYSGVQNAWAARDYSKCENVVYDGPLTYKGTTYYNPERVLNGSCVIGNGSYMKNPYLVKLDEQAIYKGNGKNHSVKSYPYAESADVESKTLDTYTTKQFTIDAVVTNQYGNTWYRLDDQKHIYAESDSPGKRAFIYSGDVSFVKDAATVEWVNDNLNGKTLPYGKSYVIGGSIKSSNTIKSIYGSLSKVPEEGFVGPIKPVFELKSYTPSGADVSIAGSVLDTSFPFARLAPGKYKLEYKVTYYYNNKLSEKTVSCAKTFTIGNASGGSTSAPAVTKVSSITLDKGSVALDYSQSATLTATVSPSNATNKDVTWSTSNGNVARLSATSGGKIMLWAVGDGTATITCAAADGSGKKATCTVTVKSPSTLQITGVDYPATFKINPSWGWVLGNGTVSSNYELKTLSSVIKNASGSVIGNAYTANISGKRYEIKNINSQVPFSKITAAGKYTWTLTASDSSGRSVALVMNINAVKSGSNSILGASQYAQDVPVASIAMEQAISLNASKGETHKLSPVIAPSDATNKNVKWTTSSAAVATVGSDGTVYPHEAGTATVTCTAADGHGASARCTVYVTADKKVTGITLNATEITLNKSRNETWAMQATISPSDATNQKVNWSTSNKAVATISADGVVKPVAAGTATVTCTAADGSSVSKSCDVIVIVDTKVTKIELNETEVELAVRAHKGETVYLEPSFTPSNATNQNVRWTSSDTTVATVLSVGLVTAVGKGTAKITCAALDGSGVTASCTVKVHYECDGWHNYDEYGRCKDCDYVCDHKNAEYVILSDEMKSEGKAVYLDAETHRREYVIDIYKYTYCLECGANGRRELVVSNAKTSSLESHNFWNDEGELLDYCVECGAPYQEESWPCKHKNTHIEEYYDYENAQYTSIDDRVHRVDLLKERVKICDDCGEVVTVLDAWQDWTTGEHFYEETYEDSGVYRCYDCGHEIRCTHKNAQYIMEERAESALIQYRIENDAEKHQIITEIEYDWLCPDCGSYLEDEDHPTIYTIEIGTEPHEYVNDLCVDCGYTRCAGGKHKYTKTAKLAEHDEKEHWWVCTKCGAKVAVAEHSFNASGKCAACGYVCPHDHLEQGEETEKLVKVAAVDDANHSRTVKLGRVCPDCGAKVYDARNTILTEAHSYDAKGKCAVCKHACKHKQMVTQEVETDATYSNIKDATHSSVTVRRFEDTCVNCGYVKKRSSTVRLKNVGHSYEDGVCTLCGHACAHSKTANAVNVVRLDWLATDGPHHTPYNRTTTTQNCAYCGEYIGTQAAEAEGKPEAHRYGEDGRCEVCGIERPVIEEIEIGSPDVVLGVGETRNAAAAYSPVAVDDRLTYVSSAPQIAKVSAKGVVTPLKAGEAVITARSECGDASDSFTVTVVPKPTKIALTASKLTLGVGDESYLMLKSITPANASSNISYTSSNKKVATVDAFGTVTALKAGSATITAKTYNGKKATCKVTVKGAPKSISLNPAAVELSEGQSARISVKLPKNTAASYSYEVISGGENVSVDGGVVYALTEGEATVRVRTHNGAEADYRVTILPAPTEVTLNAEALALGKGETFSLKYAVDRGKTDITYVTSDASVAKVSSAGKITAQKKVGSATITAVAHNGVAASVEVTVANAPGKVTLDCKSKVLKVGETFELTAALPANTASKLTVSASGKGIVELTEEPGAPGVYRIAALKKGTSTITVKTFNGKKATCKVTVK